MSVGAIIMMIISIGLVWGGLVLAVLRLRRFSNAPAPDAPDSGAAASDTSGDEV